MRKAVALALAVAALASAAYLGDLRLDAHGNYPICLEIQLPVAVVIVALGVLGAVVVVSRAKTEPERAEG
jgi:hypothetical protein